MKKFIILIPNWLWGLTTLHIMQSWPNLLRLLYRSPSCSTPKKIQSEYLMEKIPIHLALRLSYFSYRKNTKILRLSYFSYNLITPFPNSDFNLRVLLFPLYALLTRPAKLPNYPLENKIRKFKIWSGLHIPDSFEV